MAFALTPRFLHAAEEAESAVSSLAPDTLRAEQLIAQGEEHAKIGRDAQALQSYQRAWRWDPTRVDALRPIPPLAAKLSRLDTAARYALIVVRTNATEAVRSDPALYHRLAGHASEQGNHALAAELWESLYLQTKNKSSRRDRLRTAFEVGRQWFLAGDVIEASDWFQKVAEQPPDDASSLNSSGLWGGLIISQLKAERYDRVELAIERLEENAGNTSRAAFWRAHLALKQNQPAVALEQIYKCMATGDTGPKGSAYKLLAKALRATNQLDRSALELQRLHDNRPHDPAAWLTWIDQLIATGNSTEALEQSNQLVETCLTALMTDDLSEWDDEILADAAGRQIVLLSSQKDVDPLWPLLVDLNEWWGSLEPVLDSIEQALSQDTFAKTTHVWLANRRPDKMSLDELAVAGRMAIALDRTEDAARFYKPLLIKCVALDAEHPDDSPMALDCLQSWLYDLIGLEAWPQVIETIAWARKHDVPEAESADISYWLTYAYRYTNQSEKALAAIRSARELEPDDLITTELEAMLLAEMLRADEAIVVAQVGISRSAKKDEEPDETTKDLQLALAMWLDERAGPTDSQQAVELYETILDTWPLDPHVNNDLAFCWAERGVHLDRSLRMAQLVVEASPDNASFADTLGWVYFRLGKHEEAIRELRRAVGLIPPESESASYAILYEHLAAALEATGDTDAAAKAQAKAERLRDTKN